MKIHGLKLWVIIIFVILAIILFGVLLLGALFFILPLALFFILVWYITSMFKKKKPAHKKDYLDVKYRVKK